MDFTGTGNTLSTVNPAVLRLIMDSLCYFVLECRVDGFRFDLAAALARELYDVDRLSSFFDVIHQDPCLSQVKLIAEPWDVGPVGYQVGNSRSCGQSGTAPTATASATSGAVRLPVSQLAQRLAGSADLDQSDGRRPVASINFITAHDGFTLADLVSPLVELRRGRTNRRPGDHRAARAPAAQRTDDVAALTRRFDAARW